MTWTKLSTQIFRNGTTTTKYLLNGSRGGVLKCTNFAKGSKMYNLEIGSTHLYSFKGKPISLDVCTAKAANGKAAGTDMFKGNFEDVIQKLRDYIKRRS